MGRLFLEHPGGAVIYSCRGCKTPLTNSGWIESRDYMGATGRSYLFGKVVNVIHGSVELRPMISGAHYVRDVRCKKCDEKLGWFYEIARTRRDSDRKDKEGRTVLELALIERSRGFPEIGDDDSPPLFVVPRLNRVLRMARGRGRGNPYYELFED